MSLKTWIDKAEAEAAARLNAESKARLAELNQWIDANASPEEREAHSRCLLHSGPELSDAMLLEINITRAEMTAILADCPEPTPEDEALANGLYARIPAELKARLDALDANG